MKKQALFLALLSLLLLFAGCQSGYKTNETAQAAEASDSSVTSVQPPEISETPAISSEVTPPASGPDETKPAEVNGLYSYSIVQNGAAVTVSQGMTLGEVTALLDQAGITYSDGNYWEDSEPGEEVSGISLKESDTREYLDFSEDDKTLDHIQWLLAEGEETAFSGCVTAAIETYGFLPEYYHSGSGNDAFVFPLDGWYYTQFHDYCTDDQGDGQVTAYLSDDDLYAGNGISTDYAYLLSKDVSYADSENAADLETVLAGVRVKYGETDREGNKYSYTFEGIALCNQQLYYSISSSSRVEDEEGGGHSSYNEQIYVSLDGNTMLRGEHEKVLPD